MLNLKSDRTGTGFEALCSGARPVKLVDSANRRGPAAVARIQAVAAQGGVQVGAPLSAARSGGFAGLVSGYGRAMATIVIDSDVYYKGVAGDCIQELADYLLHIAQEAEREQAHEAALHLADASTQLLGVGVDLAGRRYE